MTTTGSPNCGKGRQPAAGPARRRPAATVRGKASRRLNQKVWAVVGGKLKNVPFHQLVETVFYVMKPDVRLLDGPPQGTAGPTCSGPEASAEGNH